jgi:hypothetical protein
MTLLAVDNEQARVTHWKNCFLSTITSILLRKEHPAHHHHWWSFRDMESAEAAMKKKTFLKQH